MEIPKNIKKLILSSNSSDEELGCHLLSNLLPEEYKDSFRSLIGQYFGNYDSRVRLTNSFVIRIGKEMLVLGHYGVYFTPLVPLGRQIDLIIKWK